MTATQEVRGAATYRGLFAQPVLRRLAVADVCARLPQGMVSITLLLVAAQHASMAVAGLVVAGYTLGQAVTGPVRGRLADQRGLVLVAALCSAGYALALLALLAGTMSAAPAWLLIGIATVAGLVNPPLSPGMRSLWSRRAGPRLSQTAFALDAAVFDLAYITGPVLASGLATGLAPAAAVAVLLTLTGAAVLTIVTPARRPGPGEGPPGYGEDPPGYGEDPPGYGEGPPGYGEGPPGYGEDPPGYGEGQPGYGEGPPGRGEPVPARQPRRGPLRSATLRRLLVTAALTNAALSATEVALTAYARHQHALWASGPLLAGVSIGSIVGSLFLGNQGHQLRRLLAGYAVGLSALTAAGLAPPLLAVAAPLAGLCLGPTLATLFGAAARAAPPDSGTETQSWVNSIMNGGAAVGAALAGLASGQPIVALGLAAAIAVAAAASAHHDPFGAK